MFLITLFDCNILFFHVTGVDLHSRVIIVSDPAKRPEVVFHFHFFLMCVLDVELKSDV